ncbi:MAG: hypothetical protein ACE5EH_12965 [Gammaproteobacteria bacterium]
MKNLIIILFLISPALVYAQPTSLQTANAKLTWNSNTEPDMAEYIIMMGEVSGVYNQTKPITHVHGVSTQTGEFAGLVEGKTYFFAVKACDTNGNCSDSSQEVSGVVVIPPDIPSGLGVTININIGITVP